MTMRPRHAIAFAALLLTSLLGACGSSAPTRFYVLNSVADKPAQVPGQGVSVVVGPVTMPQYLDRPQIVTKAGDNRLALGEFDQWGGSLNDNFTRTLTANLAVLLQSDRVMLYPARDATPVEYQVTADVTKFETDAAGAAVLGVSWSILNPKDSTVLAMRRSSYQDTGAASSAGTAGASHSYDAIAAAMSRDLELLSRDIAERINGLKGTRR